MINSYELKVKQVSKVFSYVRYQQTFFGDDKKNTGELKIQSPSFIAGQGFNTAISSFLSENDSKLSKISDKNRENEREIVLK